MMIVKGGVTTPKGFLASGVSAGIKKSGKKDLGLLCSQVPAVAAGAFTTNRFQASPVKVSKMRLKNKIHQAIIVNSGNANCANGRAGDRDASVIADFIARTLSMNKGKMLVASTGLIGSRLPAELIIKAVPHLISGLSKKNGSDFSEAILTTDTVKKESAIKVKVGNSPASIGGACKGAGMIYPNLSCEMHATMLCFITTDVSITKRMLEEALDEAIRESFNMISIDGDTSTNDSCFILANGLAGNRRIEAKNKDYRSFLAALKFLMKELAKRIVLDGEGATKFVEIEVIGAGNQNDAISVARRISTSSLLKACVYGEDPNWGRVAAACGSSGVNFNPDKVDIYLGDVKVLSKGASVKNYNKDKTKKLFEKERIYIKADLNSGIYKATAWTCDLSKKYVEINAEYST